MQVESWVHVCPFVGPTDTMTDLRVAVVEDDAEYRFLLETTLETVGVEHVQSFADAESFLDSGLDVDLVLLDLTLPGMDGHACLAKVRQDQATRRIPVVILSNSTHQDDVEAAYDAGARGYLVKPVELAELEELLEDLVTLWGHMARPQRTTTQSA